MDAVQRSGATPADQTVQRTVTAATPLLNALAREFVPMGAAADVLRAALDNIRARVYGRAVEQIAAALGAAERCEDAWKGEEEARGRKAAGARRRLAAAAGAQGAPPRGARTAGSSGSRGRDGIEQERRWDRAMGDWRRWKRTKGGRDEGIGKLGLEGGAAGPRPWAGLAARVAGPSCGSWEAQLGWLLHLSFLFLNSSTRI